MLTNCKAGHLSRWIMNEDEVLKRVRTVLDMKPGLEVVVEEL